MILLNEFFKKCVEGKNVVALGAAGYEGNPRHEKRIKILNVVTKSWCGIDKNKEFIKKNKGKYKFYYADLNDLNFYKNVPKNTDLMAITEVLEHLQSPYEVLKYISKNKKSNTEVFISVPNGLSFGRIIYGIISRKRLYGQDVEHLSLYNRQTLKNLLSEAGFAKIEIHPYVQEKSHYSLLKFFPEFASGFAALCK